MQVGKRENVWRKEGKIKKCKKGLIVGLSSFRNERRLKFKKAKRVAKTEKTILRPKKGEQRSRRGKRRF